jgi:hypothetical protein
VATNVNSENARRRMEASLRGSVGTGKSVDELSTGHIWAAGFHHVTAHSRLACGLKLMNHFFNFPIYLGRGKLWILNQQIWGHDYIKIQMKYMLR